MEINNMFCAELTAYIPMTDEEFNYIFETSKRHYDTTIKMSTDVGGWLYGMKVRRTPWKGATHDDVNKNVEANNRKIQLMIKCLEMSDGELPARLNIMLHKVYSELVQKTNLANEIINKP